MIIINETTDAAISDGFSITNNLKTLVCTGDLIAGEEIQIEKFNTATGEGGEWELYDTMSLLNPSFTLYDFSLSYRVNRPITENLITINLM